MNTSWMRITGLCLIYVACSSSQTPRNVISGSLASHHHSDTDLDVVQCHNAVYKVGDPSRQPEPVSGAESRSDPSRQYLPPPEHPKPLTSEKDPSASFDQPEIISVKNTFLSPNLQTNYNSLFGGSTPPDQTGAAENVANNSILPPASVKTNRNNDSEDEKYSLEKLCNDAFHSFLCKPIAGPRKTPNGRIRPNAVLPPGVLAGQPSSQDQTKVHLERFPPKNNNYNRPAVQQLPPNQYQQGSPFHNQLTSKRVLTSTKSKGNPVFTELSSPTNIDNQFLKPQPSNEAPLKTLPQTNGYYYETPNKPSPTKISYPSNKNEQFISPKPTNSFTILTTTTSGPLPSLGYSYRKPSIPIFSNTSPRYDLPSKSLYISPYTLNNQKSTYVSFQATPSNVNPSVLKPFKSDIQPSLSRPKQEKDTPYYSSASNDSPSLSQITTRKPFTTKEDCKKAFQYFFDRIKNENPNYLKPDTNQPFSSNNIPSYSTFPIIAPKPQPQQEYVKPKPNFNPIVGNPSNQSPLFIKPVTSKSLFPTTRQFDITTTQKTPATISEEECDKHKKLSYPVVGKARLTTELTTPQSKQPIAKLTSKQPDQLEIPNSPSASNNIAEILAQPDGTQSTTTKPDTEKGYSYEKPSIPFPPPNGYPSDSKTNSVTIISTDSPYTISTTTKNTNGYVYEPPNIAFGSNNFAQVVPQVPQTITEPPCQHNHQLEGNPSNEYSESVRPENKISDSSKISFPSVSEYSASHFNSGFKPYQPTTQKTTIKYNIPVQQTYYNLEAKPQTQTEFVTRPLYSYQPANTAFQQSPINNKGYSYPRPAIPFIR